MQQQKWSDQLIQLIRERKSQLNQFIDVLYMFIQLLRNDKYYENCVQISRNADQLVQRSQLDLNLFLKRIFIFGMVIHGVLEVRNSQDKLAQFYELCRLFSNYVPTRLTNKDEIKYIIQTAIPESKLRLLNEFQTIQMSFPRQLSFQNVVMRFSQVMDLMYNAFADSIFMGAECQEYIRKCDQIVLEKIISPIQSYIEQITQLQFEDEIGYLLGLDGIISKFDYHEYEK